MDWIVIDGVQTSLDGRYPLDLEGRELTTREWGWIKRLAGYLPLALDEQAFGDPELITVLAAVALRRAGKVAAPDVPRTFETLSDAPFGSAILLETDTPEEREGDAGPPPSSSTSNGDGSGAGSAASSGTSTGILSSSGTPGSGSSTSAPPRLGN